MDHLLHSGLCSSARVTEDLTRLTFVQGILLPSQRDNTETRDTSIDSLKEGDYKLSCFMIDLNNNAGVCIISTTYQLSYYYFTRNNDPFSLQQSRSSLCLNRYKFLQAEFLTV